jgi:Ammonium Transporter Family
VNILGAFIVGLAAGIVCSFAVGLKFRWGYDDSLDVVGVHFVGGLVGVLLIGLIATEVMTGGALGLFYGGGFTQLGKQSLAAVVVAIYAFTVSFVVAKLIDRHGLSGQRRRRNDGGRLQPACRDRVRRGRAWPSAVAPPRFVREPRRPGTTTRVRGRKLMARSSGI